MITISNLLISFPASANFFDFSLTFDFFARTSLNSTASLQTITENWVNKKVFPRFVEDFFSSIYSLSRQGMKVTEGRKKMNTCESINTSSALSRMKISLIKKMLNCFDVGKKWFSWEFSWWDWRERNRNFWRFTRVSNVAVLSLETFASNIDVVNLFILFPSQFRTSSWIFSWRSLM